MKTPKQKCFGSHAEAALKKIDEAVDALEQCQGNLIASEYTALRVRSGHLMDTLYRVGDALSRAT